MDNVLGPASEQAGAGDGDNAFFAGTGEGRTGWLEMRQQWRDGFIQGSCVADNAFLRVTTVCGLSVSILTLSRNKVSISFTLFVLKCKCEGKFPKEMHKFWL